MWRALSHLMVDMMADLTAMSQLSSTNGTDPAVFDHLDPRGILSDVLELLDAGISRLAAFSGLVAENLTRGQSLTFLDMGRRLERSLQVSSLLRCTLCIEARNESSMLEALLEIADSSMTYRRRYFSTIQAAPVLDLLLADETNPRSLAYQLAALSEGIDRLPRDPSLPGRSPEQRLVLANLTELRLADVEALARATSRPRRGPGGSSLQARGCTAASFRWNCRQLFQPSANFSAPWKPGSQVSRSSAFVQCGESHRETYDAVQVDPYHAL